MNDSARDELAGEPGRLQDAPLRSLVYGFGGTVEPADRFERALEQPPVWKGEYFEVRDPASQAEQRAGTPYQIERLADRIGSGSYTRIAHDGSRTVFEKVDGSWREGSTTAPLPSLPNQPAAREPSSNPELQALLTQRFLIGPPRYPLDEPSGQTQYRYRERDTLVAFAEWDHHLSTDTNLPLVARSMVDVAELRGWGALRVSGDQQFKQQVWLEAALRGVKTVDHEPTATDLDRLRKESAARTLDPPSREQLAGAPTPPRERSTGRNAVLAAIDAVLAAKDVPEVRRAEVVAAAADKLAQRAREGQPPLRVKVYDPAAPSRRPEVAMQTPQSRVRVDPTR